MLHRSRASLSAALVLGTALALAGCSGGEAAPPRETGSPLEHYFTLLGGSDVTAQRAQETAIQDAIATCMNDAGFDYTPAPGAVAMYSSDSLDVEWGSAEFAERYGYGISTDPFGMEDDLPEERDDPNSEYVDSLSESERAAYEEALYGTAVEEGGDYNWSIAGCMGSAQHEATADVAYWDDPAFESLSEEMNAIPSNVERVDAVVERANAWAECMADAGHPGLASSADAQAGITEEFNALLDVATDRPDDAPDAGADGDDGGMTFVTGGEVDPEKRAALEEKEIELAVADSTCAESTGYGDVVERETNRLEQDFVDRNRSALDALVAKYGEK